jgi:hypothetical protein
MKLDFSRYSAYVQNPERYRLRYVLNLAPENDNVPTFMNYGRRRGTCTHEILDARATGGNLDALRGKFPGELFDRCLKLADKMPDLGPFMVSEKEFDIPIFAASGNLPASKHSTIGRIDHVFMRDRYVVGDFKTCKKRTKKEASQYLGELSTSFQVPFYLHAAKSMGYETDTFIFHVLIDEKDNPDYLELPVIMGPAEVERRLRHVRAACYAIEGLLRDIGSDYPWPHSNAWPCCGDKLFCGYGEICGMRIPLGAIPYGFVPRQEHLAQLMDPK